ncbi:MAG: NusG domain II-containing protein [Clostridia bacterium]|nr:NusG domain II-containing protein [Clostridia bacterium]
MKPENIRSFIKQYRVDIIVVAFFLVLSIAVLLITNFSKTEGTYVQVTLDGNIVGEYSLTADGIYSLNGGTNTLTVQSGVAYMSYSNCPDHVCENTGKIQYVGQTIICLPNRLTISIIGESDEAVDFIS